MSFSIPTLRSFMIKNTQSGSSRNWLDYCRWMNSTANGWGILLNGVDAKDAGTTFLSGVTINFNQDVFNIITDYPSVSVTYSISRAGPGAACKYTPNPLTGTVTVGMSNIILTVPGGCVDTIDWEVTLTFTGFDGSWWNTNCCSLGYCTYNGFTGWSSIATGLTLD